MRHEGLELGPRRYNVDYIPTLPTASSNRPDRQKPATTKSDIEDPGKHFALGTGEGCALNEIHFGLFVQTAGTQPRCLPSMIREIMLFGRHWPQDHVFVYIIIYLYIRIRQRSCSWSWVQNTAETLGRQYGPSLISSFSKFKV